MSGKTTIRKNNIVYEHSLWHLLENINSHLFTTNHMCYITITFTNNTMGLKWCHNWEQRLRHFDFLFRSYFSRSVSDRSLIYLVASELVIWISKMQAVPCLQKPCTHFFPFIILDIRGLTGQTSPLPIPDYSIFPHRILHSIISSLPYNLSSRFLMPTIILFGRLTEGVSCI